MVKKHTATVYTSDKAEGFELTFEPVEDTIKVTKTDTGYTVKYATSDDDGIDPRDDDNRGIMAFFHSRYNLGDKDHGVNKDDYSSWGAMEKALVKHGAYMVIPVFMYDHSGITIRAGHGFGDIDSAGWDWGQIGFIYVTKEKVLKEYKKLGKKTRDTVKKVLLGEIETYDLYLRGESYGIVSETYDNEKVQIDHDSCWGCLGIESVEEIMKEEE